MIKTREKKISVITDLAKKDNLRKHMQKHEQKPERRRKKVGHTLTFLPKSVDGHERFSGI